MMEYLLLIILLIALLTLYLHNKIVNKSQFDKIVRIFLLIMILDVSNSIFWSHFNKEKAYLDWAVPFALVYGPLFYFSYNAAHNIVLKRKKVFLHLIPLALFFLGYVYFVSSSLFREQYYAVYFLALYSAITFSMFSYSIWGLVFKGIDYNRIAKSRKDEIKKYIAAVSLVFMVIALLFVVFMYAKFSSFETHASTSIIFIYLILFAILYLTFRYTTKRISENNVMANIEDNLDLPVTIDKKEEVTIYQKSAISKDLIKEYERKFNQKIEEKVYLDPHLTLESLASDLKIPKHHLTQVLSLHIGQSFNHYINDFRIQHACSLLQDVNSDFTIEKLAHESGFNSKSSFNRNFKNYMGYTPSQYRLNTQLETKSNS